MQVSFNGTCVINEIYRPTKNQLYIDDAVERAFQQEEDYYAPYSDKSKTVEKLLDEKKRADVLIKNKKDGSVDVEVRREYVCLKEDDCMYISSYEGYIPYDAEDKKRLKKTNIRLTDEANIKKSLKIVQERLDNFAIKCRAYALAPNTKKNDALAKKHEIKLEKELAELEKQGFFN